MLIPVYLFFAVAPALAFDVENADRMPYPVDTALIEEVWGEVVRVTNAEALVLKVEESVRPPRIRYDSSQPQAKTKLVGPTKGEIEYWVSKKTGKVLMDRPRFVVIYPAAFQLWAADYNGTGGLFKRVGWFPEQVYGVIAQEFFHEALFHQYVADDHHHCAMIFRGTLEKVLRFIDARLGTEEKVTNAIMADTKGQCEKDSRGRVRFPAQFQSR